MGVQVVAEFERQDKIILHRIISVVYLHRLSTQSRSRCSHEDETWLPILSVRLAASSFPLRWLGLPTMIVHLRVSYPGGWMGSCLSGHALDNSKIIQMNHVRHRRTCGTSRRLMFHCRQSRKFVC
uniref:Uncharacterized protein n=1 Tax=Trichogramma kaykai TaxID=54128 RepID=A0ABD2WXM8_9HYME